jgi:cobalt-zinc-cadmium efflux system outer membrane protein
VKRALLSFSVWALTCAFGSTAAKAQPVALDDPPDVPMFSPKPIVTLTPPPQPQTPLTLEEVLTSVDTRFPLLVAERKAMLAAEGEEYSAWGSFDPKWKTKGSLFPVGYYQYGMIDSVIEQPLYWRGISVFGGYRLGQGKFPLYYDGYRTNSLGEARVGLVVPLLRGGSIDEERAKLWKAEAGVDAAREGVAASKLEFQRSAAYKYWEWVAAAKKLEIAKRLLQRALDRNVAITARVARGDAAAVDQTDNARAIVQREQQVVTAERVLVTARLSLSLYLRDGNGDPIIPSPERVPSRFPEPARLDAPTVENDVSRAIGKRPEVRVYEARRRQYGVERSLAENDAWPTLNVLVAGAKQFGDGYPERQPAALEAGLLLDIPLRTRKADGRARAADARFMQYDIQLRYVRDKIALEVRDAAAGTDAAAARLGLARRELDLAQQLEQAERQRFDMGDSTILFVNLREQASFDAATRELDTLLEHHKAWALYRTVIGGS